MDPEFEEQHPIPQQISSYHFKLVGDMTLKQFFEVAGGSLFALLIYSTSLNPLIKIPVILLSFLFGVALAFFPLQDRPLEKWIYLFFKSIYSPTLFVWKKSATPPSYFQPEDQGLVTPIQPQTPEEEATLTTQQPAATPAEKEAQSALTELEEKEEEFLSKVTDEFSEEGVPKPPAVSAPKQEVVEIEKVDKVFDAAQDQAKAQEDVSEVTRRVAPFAKGDIDPSAGAPSFIPEASPPTPPVAPNMIVGQVTDPKGKIIDSAIMDIRDENGRPARAFKSNKLGHFMIATPLVDGKYNLTIEKDGYEFEPVTLEARGEIIPPMSIIGKEVPGQTNIN